MSTGKDQVVFNNKQLIPRQRWDDNFLAFLRKDIQDLTIATYQNSGTLTDTPITIGSSTDDSFFLDISGGAIVVDGLGHIIDLAQAGFLVNAFENTNLDTYFVGVRYAQVPNGVERNPRTSNPNYKFSLDLIGEFGEPDSVVDLTTFIRLTVDGLTEVGVDHSGRAVTVSLKTPVSPDETIAFHSGSITFVGGINVVDIPYTVAQGPLGQTAPAFPISLDATKYQVHVEGPSWFKNTDLRLDPTNYVFIGIITGNGPAATPVSFDITDQNTVFILSLDRAYRGAGFVPSGDALGRTIFADAESVIIRQNATSQRQHDRANAAFLIDKQNETIGAGTGLLSYHDFVREGHSRWALQQLADTALGGVLQPVESVNLTTAPDTVTFTRGGTLDLQDGEIQDRLFVSGVGEGMSFVLITGSALGNNGLYRISSTTGNTAGVVQLDGTTASLTVESGVSATVLTTSYQDSTSSIRVGAPYSGDLVQEKSFDATGRGVHMRMLGRVLGLGFVPINSFQEYSHHDRDGDNVFFRQLLGQAQQRGGGAELNRANLIFGEGTDRVPGHAQWQADKRDIANLTAAWQPAEVEGEWGFDYRGTDFGKDTSSDVLGFQLGSTVRLPWTDHDGGSQNILASEPFTRSLASTLDLTRVGADADNMPGITPDRIVLAEVEYDTPNAEDGVYWVEGFISSTRVNFVRLDGSVTAFGVGSGTVRFYGGLTVGGIPTTVNGNEGWLANLVQPTTEGGLLRMLHRYNSLTATDQMYAFSAHSVGPSHVPVIDWALRGTTMFANAIVTTGPSDSPITSNAVRTGNVRADNVHLSNASGWFITLPAAESDAQIMQRAGGGSYTITRVINRFRGEAFSGLASGPAADVPTWGPDNTTPLTAHFHQSQTGAGVQAIYYFPLYLPHGVTLNSVAVEVTPITGDGGGTSFGVNVRNKVWNATTGADLLSTGVVRASGGSATKQTVTYTADQNNVIDNTDTEYYVALEKSGTGAGNDLLYGLRVTFTVTNLGRSLFDAI